MLFEQPGQLEELTRAAIELARVATADLARASVPGRSSGAICTPAIIWVAREHPEWLPDGPDEEAEEQFARGASRLLLERLTEQRDGEETVAALEALARAVLLPGAGVRGLNA